jgi:iron complex outermembrane receptor protein
MNPSSCSSRTTQPHTVMPRCFHALAVIRRTFSACVLFSLAAALPLAAQTAGAGPDAPAAPSKDEPALKLDQVVVVGSVTPQTKLETALAVTTIDRSLINSTAPRSTAEMLKLVPGLYLESSGGEVGNNLVARGVATNGGVSGYLYVALQEDGLPILSESNFRFTQADTFLRVTNFVDHIEALRGGSAGVFASSDPLGIVNFVTREGTRKTQGEVKFEVGDYGLIRNEAWVAGPLGANSTYAVGGFYRLDDGLRPPGYTNSNGGQLMGNVKWNLPQDRGYLKLFAKGMDDHPGFQLPFPLQNVLPVALNSEVGVKTISGGPDLKSGAISSTDIRQLNFPSTPSGPLAIDLADGESATYYSVGSDVDYTLADGLKLKALNRYTDGTHLEVRNPFATADTLQNIVNGLATRANSAGSFAPALIAGTPNYNFALSYPGQANAVAAANPAAAATLNGNGLGVLDSMTNIKIKLKNFQQDIRLTQTFNGGRTSLTAGFYYSYFQVGTYENIVQELLDVSSNYHRLDVTFLNATTNAPIGKYTFNGITQLGTTYINSQAEKRETDWFAVATHRIGTLSLDAGYRFLNAKVSGWGEAPLTYDGNSFINSTTGGATTLANGSLNFYPGLRNAVFGGGNVSSGADRKGDHALTLGANYVFGDGRTAAFVRYSRSPKMIYTNDILLAIPFGNGSGNGTPTPFRKQNHMTQYEAGLKYSRGSIGLFLTAFRVEERNVAFADTVFLPNGSLGTGPFSTLDEDVHGLELESAWTPLPGLSINLNGTVQEPKFVNDVHIKGFDGNGNVVQLAVNGLLPVRIPKTYGTLAVTYVAPQTTLGRVSFSASYQYTGRRAIDQANSEFLAPFYELGAGIGLTMPNGVTFRVAGANLANSSGITEGDPRSSTAVVANLNAPFANYRPVLPRSITASVAYRF